MAKNKNRKELEQARQKEMDEALKNAVDDFDKFEDFFTSNLKQIIIAFVIIAVGLTVAAVGYSKYKASQLEVSAELTAANTVDELKSLIAKYKGNQSVFPATLRLGTLYFNDGKYQEAYDVFSKLALDAPMGGVKNRAALNTAYTLEALKKDKEAADRFAMIGQDVNVPGYVKDEANFAAGRIYNALKDTAKARNCLKSINYSTPGFWASQGEKLLQRIN